MGEGLTSEGTASCALDIPLCAGGACGQGLSVNFRSTWTFPYDGEWAVRLRIDTRMPHAARIDLFHVTLTARARNRLHCAFDDNGPPFGAEMVVPLPATGGRVAKLFLPNGGRYFGAGAPMV